jgi:lysophospholipase L1-like esterase
MCHTQRTRILILAVAGAVLWASASVPRRAGADDRASVARWEKAIEAFERQDKEKPPPQHAILFAGSSSIRRWDLPKYFPDMDVINRGFGGSEIADSLHFAPRIILKHRPRIVVFYAGDNDIAAGKNPNRVFADFEAFVKAVHGELPKTRIAFVSIKPSILRWGLWDKMRKANSLIEAYCKQHDRLVYIDVAGPMLGDDGKPRPELFVTDGLHLNDKGYRLWASLIKPQLK